MKQSLLKLIFSASLIFLLPGITHAAGKIENATMEEVTYAIETTLKQAQDTLAALDDGASSEDILAMLKKTKQIHKEIEVIRLGAIKGRAATQMKKARIAAKKGDLETARKHLAKGVEHYQTLRKKFYDF